MCGVLSQLGNVCSNWLPTPVWHHSRCHQASTLSPMPHGVRKRARHPVLLLTCFSVALVYQLGEAVDSGSLISGQLLILGSFRMTNCLLEHRHISTRLWWMANLGNGSWTTVAWPCVSCRSSVAEIVCRWRGLLLVCTPVLGSHTSEAPSCGVAHGCRKQEGIGPLILI